jgi:hypothetical protein
MSRDRTRGPRYSTPTKQSGKTGTMFMQTVHHRTSSSEFQYPQKTSRKQIQWASLLEPSRVSSTALHGPSMVLIQPGSSRMPTETRTRKDWSWYHVRSDSSEIFKIQQIHPWSTALSRLQVLLMSNKHEGLGIASREDNIPSETLGGPTSNVQQTWGSWNSK